MPTAIVTGAAQGIGRGVARRLLADGWQVLLADADADALADALDELGPVGAAGAAVGAVCDVADEAQVRTMVARALALGEGGIDGVVTSAGLADPGRTPLVDLPVERWQRVLDVNLTGTMLTVKHAVAGLRVQGGSVVTVASVRAHQSDPDTEAYAASKGGVVALTHALAISLAPEVRVNCISPGWIDTSATKARDRRDPSPLSEADHRQHPVGRAGVPADVAALAAWLLSAESAFMTGQELTTDGGMAVQLHYLD